MDRGVLGAGRTGHADEQPGQDGREIVDGHHRPAAVHRMSEGRRPVPYRAAVHIDTSGVFVELGFGSVLND